VSKVGVPHGACPECEKPSIDGFTHTKCQKKYGINGLLSVWNYEGVVRKAILALKYKYSTEVAEELAKYLAVYIGDKKFILGDNPVVVPVPLHWYRENFRGFNQSLLLGKAVAEKFGWRFIPDLLTRKKLTSPQVGLKGKERVENVKNVFVLNSHRGLLTANYLLFDDVYTTGSTIKEAAKVLKRKGAEKVWGLTVAR
jgi:ComF family protein